MLNFFCRVLLKKVTYLDSAGFSAACSQLARNASELILPDLVVGIATGGEIVASEVVKEFWPGDCGLAIVVCRRAMTTIKKRRPFRVFLKILPRVICNMLRRVESELRERVFEAAARPLPKSVFADDSDLVLMRNAKNILLVDDAIDSGATVHNVVEFIKSMNVDARIVVACITTTFSNPMTVPDVSLYKNVLIRFPWSEDSM